MKAVDEGRPMRAWLQAARPLAHGNLLGPLLLGQALAARITGRFDLGWFCAVVAFGIVDHLFIVFANDYADAEADRANTEPTLVSGGSRAVPDGLLDRAAVGRAAILAAASLALLSGGLVLAGRPRALLFCSAALALLYAYSYRPLRLSYRGGGELLQGVGLGVVLVLFAFDMQASQLEAFPWAILAPGILLGVASHIATALPDQAADARTSKRTLAVFAGDRVARSVAVVLVITAALLLPVTGPPLSAGGWALVIAPAALGIGASLVTIRRDHPLPFALSIAATVVATWVSSSVAIVALPA